MSQLTYGKAGAVERTAPRQRAGTAPARRRLGSVGRHLLLALVTLAFMVPFYWMVMSAFKVKEAVFTVPVQWWPQPIQWQNFVEAANYPGFPFVRFLWNSVFYAGTVTVGTVISCAFVAYGFARLRFPGREALFMVTIATLMIPTIVTFIPTFILFKSVGLLGGWAPLIAPSFFGSAFFIFLLRQFFLGLPGELADAARVDGANEFRIFAQIMLPLVQPALLVTAVFSFLWTWHEFFQPLIYLSDPDLYPLSLGLFAFRTRRLTEWHLMMAGATLTTLPLVAMFFLTQRYFLEGIKMTGLKG